MDKVAATGAPLHDFTPLGLFLQSDAVVKAVMLLLVVASVAVWAIVIDRAFRLAALRRQAIRLRAADPAGTSGNGLAQAVLRAGRDAAQDVRPDESRSERRDRVQEAMRLALADGIRAVEPGLPFLATVGSTAPFIGLFGTVWGIMTSFADIATKADTSLAVVAPGIAEALFSTALGLAAAIPAVVAYNKLVASLARSRAIAVAGINVLSDRITAPGAAALRAAE
ncbi:MAG: MotA/TolQ/ExbB proton channel family protein [Proteobacteria bacterium]|nr:MotA/TolQ/ExbB proton channel family protein [Pseudomonadota bacterium]